MKKLALSTLALLFVIVTVTVQAREIKHGKDPLKKLSGTKVSDLSKTNFYSDFGKLSNVQWHRLATFDEATFTKNGQKMTAFYDVNSILVGTTSAKKFSDLPANGQKEIKARYKEYKIGPVIFFDDNDKNETDMMMYNIQFDDADSYFVELTKANEKIVVQVMSDGGVNFFKKI